MIEAISSTGEVKQVAGVQIINETSKEINRVPFELLFVLLGASLFFYFLNQARMLNLKLEIFSEPSFSKSNFENPLTRRLRFLSRNHESASVLNNLISDEIKIESYLPRTLTAIGCASTILIVLLQFFSGNWINANFLFLSLLAIASNLNFSFGILNAAMGFIFLIVNISLARTLSEVLAFFVISSVMFLPNLYNHFLFKFFRNFKETQFSKLLTLHVFIPGVIASASSYQLILVFESLIPRQIDLSGMKEVIFLALLIFFSTKNYFLSKNIRHEDELKIVRSIGPKWTAIFSINSGLICYIWTTNILISISTFISVGLILTLNWLKFNTLKFMRSFPNLSFGFGAMVILIFFVAIYSAVKYLPFDVINRSNLMILLIFPFDLLLTIYMALSSKLALKRSEV